VPWPRCCTRASRSSPRGSPGTLETLRSHDKHYQLFGVCSSPLDRSQQLPSTLPTPKAPPRLQPRSSQCLGEPEADHCSKSTAGHLLPAAHPPFSSFTHLSSSQLQYLSQWLPRTEPGVSLRRLPISRMTNSPRYLLSPRETAMTSHICAVSSTGRQTHRTRAVHSQSTSRSRVNTRSDHPSCALKPRSGTPMSAPKQ
jgi:hypothetical protein